MNNVFILALVLMVAAVSPAVAACGGDCNVDGSVTVDEIVLGVNIALGSGAVDACQATDANADSQVTVDEIVTAVNNALSGCAGPAAGTPTATATATQASAPTPTPGLRPSPPPGCVNSKGYTRIVISEAAGTNAYRDLNQPLDMFDVSGAEIAAQRGITTNSLTCPVTLDSPIIGLTAGVNGFPQELTQGNVYPLSATPVLMLPHILITLVDYSERFATDVFNARLWRAASGTYTVASLTANTATVVIDAQMQPVPTSVATGTFRMQATVIVDMLAHN